MPNTPALVTPGFDVAAQEAIEASQARKVVLPDVYYGVMQGVERAEAFSVAGIAALDQLQGTLDSLTKALVEGQTFEQWKRDTLKAPDVLALPAHRLDNIYRTNIQGAYARGRCVHIEEHKAGRPFLLYSAVNDSRTRPAHAAMHGHVASVDDPIWKTWLPPAGFRCRCTVISLTKSQGKARQDKDIAKLYNDPDKAKARQEAIQGGPDEGWDYSPCDAKQPGTSKAKDKQMQQQAGQLHPALAGKVAEIKAQAAAIKDAENFATWTKEGGKLGSNEGGVYRDPTGVKWYVKAYADPNQAKTEIAAQSIYKMMGVETPDLKLVTHEGKTLLASRWMDLSQTGAETLAKKHATDLSRIYATSAWIKNWDVVGMSMDNIGVTSKGKLIVIDAGGSFKFKAQGKLKEYLAGPVDELEVMKNPNRTAGKVFSLLTDAKRTAAIRAMEGITKTNITQAFQAAGFDAKEVKALTDAAWARRKWMLEAVSNQAKQVIQGIGNMTVAEAVAAIKSAGLSAFSWESYEKIAREWQTKHGWSDAMTPFWAAVKAYTGSDYRTINNVLRAGSKLRVSEVMNAALATGKKYVGTVKRGARYTIDKDWIQSHRDAQATHKPVEYMGFTSSGKGKGWRKTINMVIDAKGLQGVNVNPISLNPNEGGGEVIFPHLARFFVDNVVDERDGTITIYLRESPDAFKGTGVKLSAIS